MNIVERVRRLCLSPDTEWAVIAGEHATLAALLTGYALPLAALSAIASLLGSTFIGLGAGFAVRAAIVGLVLSLIGVVILSAVIDALAPTFGAARSSQSAAKVAAYTPTPAWVAGIFQIIPVLGSLISLAGALYAFYLLYLGLRRVMKSPPDRAVAYTAVVVLVTIVAGFLVSYVMTLIGLGPGMPTIRTRS
jgi:hypothetical protein